MSEAVKFFEQRLSTFSESCNLTEDLVLRRVCKAEKLGKCIKLALEVIW